MGESAKHTGTHNRTQNFPRFIYLRIRYLIAIQHYYNITPWKVESAKFISLQLLANHAHQSLLCQIAVRGLFAKAV